MNEKNQLEPSLTYRQTIPQLKQKNLIHLGWCSIFGIKKDDIIHKSKGYQIRWSDKRTLTNIEYQ